jgi:hypothetical protein
MTTPLHSGRRMGPLRALALMLLALLATACGGIDSLPDSFNKAVLDNDDPDTVAAAIPSYLVTLDALARNYPNNADVKLAAAQLNSAYSTAFVHDSDRAHRLTAKALDYAFAALCERQKALCDPRQPDLDGFKAWLDKMDTDDVPLLFAVGSTWASWIQTRSGDFNAIADLPRVKALMERVTLLKDDYQDGSAYLYLGVMATLLTPALGGHPEEGKVNFEKALTLSQGRNLMVKVYYAKNYARSVFNRDLHDRLLNEVLAADPHASGWTLSNVLAQQQAKELLKSADDYF